MLVRVWCLAVVGRRDVAAKRLGPDSSGYEQRGRDSNPRPGAVRRALEALRDAGIIDSEGRGDWRFSNPLLRRYLQSLAPLD